MTYLNHHFMVILRHLPFFMKIPDNVELVGKWFEQFKDYGFYKIDPVICKIPFV